jgi:hypothetical protein
LGLALRKESMVGSYIFTFALTSTVMSNTCQYFYKHPPQEFGAWYRWTPFMMLSSATVLLLVSPLKQLVVNVCMQSFRENGFDSTIETALDLAYLPIFGEKHLQFYTMLAFLLMLWGTALQTNLAAKFRASLRAASRAKAGGGAAASGPTKAGG